MNDKDALLSQLRDIELPAVSATIAPGWWALMLLGGLLLCAGFWLRKRWQRTLWQRQARAELQSIRQQANDASSLTVLSQLSTLSRKIVLAVDKREQVAALHGEAWLDKLDDVCARPEFSHGIGQLLLDQPYKKQPVVAQKDLAALFDSMDVLITCAGKYKAS